MESPYISKLEADSFADIPREGITKWFWTDTDTSTTSARQGVHLEETLPTEIPPFATHIWGWGPEHFIRLRVDFSLPNGFVGVQLTSSRTGEENCVVDIRETARLEHGMRFPPVNAAIAKIMQVRLLDNPEMSVEFIELELGADKVKNLEEVEGAEGNESD